MSGKDEDGGFLSRWSRRKRAAAVEEEPATDLEIGPNDAGGAETDGTVIRGQVEGQADAALAGDVAPEETLTQEEIEALPPLDTVTSREELQLFLRNGVPKALRQAALRKVWMLNPKISGYLDVARDYAYDWNVAGGVPGNSGTLSPGEALRMVDKFLQKKPDPADEPSLSEKAPQVAEKAPGVAEIAAEEIETTAEFPQDQAETDTVTDNPQNKTFVADAEVSVPDIDSAPDDTAPRRRHGSAIPR
jgi:hypothetical protein